MTACVSVIFLSVSVFFLLPPVTSQGTLTPTVTLPNIQSSPDSLRHCGSRALQFLCANSQ